MYPYSVRMRENTDQKNSKYGHFSRSEILKEKRVLLNIRNTFQTNVFLLCTLKTSEVFLMFSEGMERGQWFATSKIKLFVRRSNTTTTLINSSNSVQYG